MNWIDCVLKMPLSQHRVLITQPALGACAQRYQVIIAWRDNQGQWWQDGNVHKLPAAPLFWMPLPLGPELAGVSPHGPA